MKLPVLSFAAKLGLIGGLLVIVGLTTAWKIEERRAEKLQTQVVRWQREFARLSSERQEQRIVTRTRIVEVERKSKAAARRAKRIEEAPLPGQCKTPEAILGADL